MIRARIVLLSLLSGLIASCEEKPTKPAEAAVVVRPTTEAEFLKAFTEASRSGRPDAVKALVHPATFQYAAGHASDFVAEWLSRESRRAIPDTRRVTTTPIRRDEPLSFEGSFVYPVRPTLNLQIDFDESSLRGVTMVRDVLVDADGVWWLVLAVPTAETIAKMQRARADERRIEKIAADLARDIEEPVLRELQALLREGKKIAAIKRYREVSGEGLRVAKSVIEAIDAKGRADSTQGESGESRTPSTF